VLLEIYESFRRENDEHSSAAPATADIPESSTPDAS